MAGPPFARLLVANRGEIAVRVMRACRELGIDTVAVYSDADSTAMHVRAADVAVRIGAASPAGSYLSVAAVMEAAAASRADALHPGYGFLSEQPQLAEACAAAGIAFVGPSPQTLAQLGNKVEARARALAADVPVVPGTSEPIAATTEEDLERVLAEAERIGFPILVKAAAGGGGRGMRRVDDPADLADAVSAAAREAAAAFGDGAVYLERYVERARHVEVQLIGDAQGTIVALGERDCSVQRRHQKLVEEAPAPGLTADQRRRLHELGVKVASTVGLVNAATAEFLLTPDGDFWFLEVNARLQVEHGVSEMVADVDLVHEQIFVAAGRPLSDRIRAAAKSATRPTRHSIEVRVSAEDPGHGFAPSPGLVTAWSAPAGPGVRVDAGVEEGSAVTSDYDPLIAKLMVVGPDREAALARMRRALEEFDIGGIQTTLPFHRWLLDEPDYATGNGLSTDLIDRCWDPTAIVSAAALRAAELVARARPGPSANADRAPARSDAQAGSETAWWRAGVVEATERRR